MKGLFYHNSCYFHTRNVKGVRKWARFQSVHKYIEPILRSHIVVRQHRFGKLHYNFFIENSIWIIKKLAEDIISKLNLDNEYKQLNISQEFVCVMVLSSYHVDRIFSIRWAVHCDNLWTIKHNLTVQIRVSININISRFIFLFEKCAVQNIIPTLRNTLCLYGILL